jgi:HPt (histidine-containing phosphotransfer) domain-containing protein
MLDKHKAIDAFHVTEAEYDQLLGEFVVQAEEKISMLTAALRRGDMTEAARITHALKGVSGNLRLETSFEISKNMDRAMKENNPAVMDRYISDLKAAVDEIRSSIKG